MTSLRAASATDAGRVRSSNQDAALVGVGIVAVADGMGGHAGGEVAARTAVQVLEAAFDGDRTAAGLVAAARRANAAIYERSEAQRELRGMGTTLTAVALVQERDGERLAVANVGDSRAYLVARDRLVQLTQDHSLVEEMVRHGEMTEAEAAVHPHRHILTRALGIDPQVEVDSWRLEPRPGARLLLCSDGLTNECSDEEIAEILRTHAEPAAAARALVQAAVEHGGSDNVTVVVADVVAEASALDGGAPRRSLEASPPAAAAAGAVAVAGAAAPPSAPPPVPPSGLSRPAARPAPSRPQRTAPPAGRPRPAPRGPGVSARRRRREDRVVTLWSVLFVVAFVAVLGGTAGFVEWYVRATYFLGFSGDHVAIFEGRPGGFLWFKPHLVETTQLTRAKVFAPYVPLLEHDMVETSYSRAREVASKLGDANAFLALPTVATTTSSTLPTSATTLAPATSTTAPAPRPTPAVGTSGGISTSGTSGISTSGTSGPLAPSAGAGGGGTG